LAVLGFSNFLLSLLCPWDDNLSALVHNEGMKQVVIDIIETPIDTAAVLSQVQSPLAGASLLFVGVTREMTGDRQTSFLHYECLESMARKKMNELANAACARWPLTGCAMTHRLGRLEISEASIAIAVSSPHRGVAFEAGQWLIDTFKEVVPIWKQEHWADGTTDWVHPGVDSQTSDLQKVEENATEEPAE